MKLAGIRPALDRHLAVEGVVVAEFQHIYQPLVAQAAFDGSDIAGPFFRRLLEGIAQALAHDLAHAEGNGGEALDHHIEVGLVEDEHLGGLGGDHRGGAGLAGQQGHLAEVVAGTQFGDQVLVTIFRGHHHFHFPVDDDIHLVAGIAGLANQFITLEGLEFQALDDEVDPILA